MSVMPGRVQLAANYYLAPPEMSVTEFMGHARQADASAIGLRLAALTVHSPEKLADMAGGHGLSIPALNSAGYFLYRDAGKIAQQADLNLRLIDAAARMRAERLVVIAGGIARSGLTLEGARARVAESLAALDERAGAAGVRLALEPIHPADLTIKGCVNSIGQAVDMGQPLASTDLVIDTFHSAWDPDIWRLSALAGERLRLCRFATGMSRRRARSQSAICRCRVQWTLPHGCTRWSPEDMWARSSSRCSTVTGAAGACRSFSPRRSANSAKC
jgi:sugar phosphate isomerase/epimerase